jgi:hypothetical protein
MLCERLLVLGIGDILSKRFGDVDPGSRPDSCLYATGVLASNPMLYSCEPTPGEVRSLWLAPATMLKKGSEPPTRDHSVFCSWIWPHKWICAFFATQRRTSSSSLSQPNG